MASWRRGESLFLLLLRSIALTSLPMPVVDNSSIISCDVVDIYYVVPASVVIIVRVIYVYA